MSVHFIVCTVAVQAIKSVMQCSFSKRRNNMTEINKRMLSLSNVSVNYAIAHTVKEQQKCCEVCFYYLWDAEEASLQTKCGSLDRCWFMVPSCPLHPYLSLPSGCICKVCTQYEVPTTHTPIFFTKPRALTMDCCRSRCKCGRLINLVCETLF